MSDTDLSFPSRETAFPFGIDAKAFAPPRKPDVTDNMVPLGTWKSDMELWALAGRPFPPPSPYNVVMKERWFRDSVAIGE